MNINDTSHLYFNAHAEDIMIPTVSADNSARMTKLTLSFLEGTGWYAKVNKQYAFDLQNGKNEGCSFWLSLPTSRRIIQPRFACSNDC